MTSKLNRDRQEGFTIIELMIATSVLATILVIVTIVMVGIGNLYYKGINQARVQDNVRSLADEMSNKLQFSDGTSLQGVAPDGSYSLTSVDGRTHVYCIGDTRYVFILNTQIDNGTRHVLWRDTSNSCGLLNLNLVTPSLGGSEVIPPNSRLTEFKIDTATSPYRLVVGVAYGDDDLLCNSDTPGDCVSDSDDLLHKAALADPTRPDGDIRCRGHAGSQFCAASFLSTTVVRRMGL
jgi:prepilin-type N-terminal cleavage/methylation domain-containing protein